MKCVELLGDLSQGKVSGFKMSEERRSVWDNEYAILAIYTGKAINTLRHRTHSSLGPTN